MNPVLIQSWYFFKNNAKEMCAFMLPVFALGMIAGVIGVINPQSGILNILNLIQIIIGPLFTGGLLFLIANISRGDHPPHQEAKAPDHGARRDQGMRPARDRLRGPRRRRTPVPRRFDRIGTPRLWT